MQRHPVGYRYARSRRAGRRRGDGGFVCTLRSGARPRGPRGTSRSETRAAQPLRPRRPRRGAAPAPRGREGSLTMCGIIGYVGRREAAPILVEGLHRLEYRGYDSAGVAVQNGAGVMVAKLAGRVGALGTLLRGAPLHGTSGIAHTRWATHGAPTTGNAHPHTDCTGTVALVHNGIIENADALRAMLERAGHRFTTETDTEALAHLIEDAAGETLEARVIAALALVEGTYGLAVMWAAEPGKIVVARQGSPVLLGIGACGTSWHAGLVGGDLIEELAGIAVQVEYASEYRYRRPLVAPGTLTLAISQSGETADTLEALRAARAAGSRVVGIVNVVGSTIARECGGGIYLHAGPEVGVASTKAFTSQIAALALLGLYLGRARGLTAEQGRELVCRLIQLPQLVTRTLALEPEVRALAARFADARNFLYLGRGVNFPAALEGALKLKEISYIHAEGYPAAEMKHGPIALIDAAMPVVFVAPRDAVYAKVRSNMQEVKARGGRLIAVTTEGSDDLGRLVEHQLRVPATAPLLSPVLTTIPLQLLAYHSAVLRRCGVDRPRNLAKSVTVE